MHQDQPPAAFPAKIMTFFLILSSNCLTNGGPEKARRSAAKPQRGLEVRLFSSCQSRSGDGFARPDVMAASGRKASSFMSRRQETEIHSSSNLGMSITEVRECGRAVGKNGCDRKVTGCWLREIAARGQEGRGLAAREWIAVEKPQRRRAGTALSLRRGPAPPRSIAATSRRHVVGRLEAGGTSTVRP